METKCVFSLVQRCHKSVEVMESNAPCTVLVLMLMVPGDAPQTLLCSLEYRDLTLCMPTHASVEADGKIQAWMPHTQYRYDLQ